MSEPVRVIQVERRWPVVLAIVALLFLLVVLPDRIRLLPLWALYITGAVVLAPESDPKRGVLATQIYADGQFSELLCIPAGGSREPLDASNLGTSRQYVAMNGREVYKHAVRNISGASKQVLDERGLRPDDIDWVIAHQANISIIEGVAERVGIPKERFFLNIDRYGNTSSASVPIALDEAVRSGKVKSGHTLLLSAFGGGFAWGTAIVGW